MALLTPEGDAARSDYDQEHFTSLFPSDRPRWHFATTWLGPCHKAQSINIRHPGTTALRASLLRPVKASRIRQTCILLCYITECSHKSSRRQFALPNPVRSPSWRGPRDARNHNANVQGTMVTRPIHVQDSGGHPDCSFYMGVDIMMSGRIMSNHHKEDSKHPHAHFTHLHEYRPDRPVRARPRSDTMNAPCQRAFQRGMATGFLSSASVRTGIAASQSFFSKQMLCPRMGRPGRRA
ncbi:hypothetical protein C8Q73DRAFT_511011 [Cubamyces lactineus]|nr:hypothetical protein C8Q73DRAFT_511011 [Cubamyces lactineus]